MVRRRVSAVSNHVARGPSFETPRSLSSGAHTRDPVAAPQDEDFLVVRSYTTTLSRFAARVIPV